MTAWRTVRPLRGITFDIENKPGTYGPGDYTHPKITAIGWKPIAEESPHMRSNAEGRILERDDVEGMVAVCEEFRQVWDAADYAVGHNIRRHDVKILGGLYMALGLELLPEKRMVDTYLDMPKVAGMSRSLENLAARWKCPIRKPHLEEHVWEAAYDGVEWAVDVMRGRVMADCAINEWLYVELVRRGLLNVA